MAARSSLPFALLAAALLMQAEIIDRRPVLVELFTSEGCSSCPPADALLIKLDHDQPVEGAQIVVLSEHVDYWDHDGWKDPYSSALFTQRQETYDRRFGLTGPYTPEMVVDGAAEFNGSDARKAETAIRAATVDPKLGVHLTADGSAVAVEIDPLPVGLKKAGVFAARALETGTSDVLRGENQGRKISHVAIVKEIQQIGSLSERGAFKKRINVADGERLIVFVQDSASGKVLGVAMHGSH